MLLKSIIISFMLEGGFIPSSLLVSGVPDLSAPYGVYLKTDYPMYTTMEAAADIWRHLRIDCGMTSYQVKVSGQKGFYPFRMDFNLGIEAYAGPVAIGYRHGCNHTMTPLINEALPGKFDFFMDRIYARIEIKKDFSK